MQRRFIMNKALNEHHACPSCGCGLGRAVDSIATSDIVSAYRTCFGGIDVTDQFPAASAQVRLLHCPNCDLRWYDPMAAGDDKLYEQLQKHDWYYQGDKAEFGFVSGLIGQLPGRPRVLEVGCGRGAFGLQIQDKVDYLGLEYNDLAAQRARSAGLDVHRRSVSSEVERNRGEYDVVCHFQVLEHVADVSGFMRDCVALLRPGGLFVVSVPAEDSMVGLSPSNWLNMPPHHVTRWSDLALAALFDRLGVPGVLFWHEPVATYHQDWYRSTLRLRALARLGLGRNSLQEPPRAVRWLARRKAIASLLEKLGSHGFPYPNRGMTVTAYGHRQ